jgi:hypothetical protein
MKRAILSGSAISQSRDTSPCKSGHVGATTLKKGGVMFRVLRCLAAISTVIVIFVAVIGALCAAHAQISAPTPKATQARPQGKRATPARVPAKELPKPATPKPPEPEPEVPYPEIPQAPKTLELTGKALLSQGDSWTYLVSSSNPQMDGKLLRVTLTRRDETSATVTLAGDGVAQPEVKLVWNGVGWFSPVTDADGKIGIKLFWRRPADWTAQGPKKAAGAGQAKLTPDQIQKLENLLHETALAAQDREKLEKELKEAREAQSSSEEEEADAARILNFPIKVEAGSYTSFFERGRREQNFVTGVSKVWPGSDLEITGPQTCVVPAGAFASGVFAFTGPSGRVIACFDPVLPVAVRARSIPKSGSGWLLFELHSYETAGTPKSPQFPDLPTAERQKALDWIQGKTSPGKSYDPVATLLFALHEAVRSHPREIVRVFMSPGITNDDKGYVAEWKAWKFSVREMTPEEVSAEPKESMKTQIAPRETAAIKQE